MTEFRFPTRRERVEAVKGPDVDIRPYRPPRERGRIMGRVASYAEWIVALALWRLKLEFIFQKSIKGTKYKIDFFIEAAPLWIMLDVNQYSGNQQTGAQRFRKKVIERVMNRPLFLLWDTQVSTFEEAITSIRRILN